MRSAPETRPEVMGVDSGARGSGRRPESAPKSAPKMAESAPKWAPRRLTRARAPYGGKDFRGAPKIGAAPKGHPDFGAVFGAKASKQENRQWMAC